MIKDIFNGIQAYFSALSLLSKLNLWSYFILPIVISFVLGIFILFTAYGLSDNIGSYIASIWKFSWGKETVTSISYFIGGLIVIAFGIVIFKHILMAVAAPFMTPISEKIEMHLTGTVTKQHIGLKAQTSALARGIRINLRNLIVEILWIIPFFIFSFIPLIGFIFLFLIFLIQAYYAGFGNMDYTLERYFSYRESVDFVRKNRGIAIGNGIVFMLILLIPIVGILIVLPLSVVASTTETLKALHPEKFAKNRLQL
ncbi:EI24 domain-containing protein [Kordia jejudonensis]|uniref:EI24 domain-containing protein n=1 Tax=Kordia jejudonensis TaxID=1348245 RepID=UPI00062973B0|nr:EI24 domain-containing protein [Kordia jejudonensis]